MNIPDNKVFRHVEQINNPRENRDKSIIIEIFNNTLSVDKTGQQKLIKIKYLKTPSINLT